MLRQTNWSNETFPPRDVILSDVHVGRVMESRLPTAERKARWLKDFDAKGHIRQSRPNRGRPFYARNTKGTLCYAVVGGTIELHGQSVGDTGAPAKVGNRRALSVYANTRPGKIVKGRPTVTEETVSK